MPVGMFLSEKESQTIQGLNSVHDKKGKTSFLHKNNSNIGTRPEII